MVFKACLASEARVANMASGLFTRCVSSSAAGVALPKTVPISSVEDKYLLCRTLESNPINHGPEHVGLFYNITSAIKNQLFQHGGFPKSFEKQVKTFGESCLMVRKPAVELIRYLNVADYSRPAIRYVVYGQPGCGKSVTLAHILHYGLNAGNILIHVPWVPNWMRRCKEVSNSASKEGFVDLNIDAATWLLHFKTQNIALLQQLDLRISKEYVWSKREVTNTGAPLMELVDLGINRVKYASNCVIAVVKEIKALSTQGRCKTLVVIDGFNSFFQNKTLVKAEDKSFVPPSRITLTEAFMEITQFNWCNGAVVVSVDRLAMRDDRWDSDLPVYQLGKEGFEHLDPFVPINVPDYSEKEFNSCIDYYIDRQWLQNKQSHTEEGRMELAYLSARNPYNLMNICAPL